MNLATQVGHGTVRTCVIGFEDRAPNPEELDRMRGLVAESLDAGALGFSTGLYYARTDEVVALAREAAQRGKLYSTHMRDEGANTISLFGSVEESLAIGRLSGVRVQISHLKCAAPSFWGRTLELLDRLDRGRTEGLDVAADQYPYTASSTGLSGAILPRWAQVGGGRQPCPAWPTRSFTPGCARRYKPAFRAVAEPTTLWWPTIRPTGTWRG